MHRAYYITSWGGDKKRKICFNDNDRRDLTERLASLATKDPMDVVDLIKQQRMFGTSVLYNNNSLI